MSGTPLFTDRTEAGAELAQLIQREILSQGVKLSPIVYALPRGGVPVGEVVAAQLRCPLDVIVSKKITLPSNPELAIGATTTEGNVVWGSPRLLSSIGVSKMETALSQAQEKALSRWQEFSPYCPQINPQQSLALIVDDGIATGMTMFAAAQAIKSKKVQQVWICAPVAPKDLIPELHQWGDAVIIAETPELFLSVSRFYLSFPQVSTEEALACLQRHNQKLLLL